MSDYSKITNFLSKDSLTLNDPAKYVKGSEIDAEYNAIAVAIATKADTASPTLVTPNIGAATGTSLVLSGLATVNGAFTSLGLDDNATAKALTLSGSGANSVTIANSATNPTIGTTAGSLSLTSAIVTSSTLTVGTNLFANGYGQVNSNDATPAGGGADHGVFIGSGAIGITVGSGLPTSTVADGSIYIRTDGGSGTTIYQRRAGNWIATAA